MLTSEFCAKKSFECRLFRNHSLTKCPGATSRSRAVKSSKSIPRVSTAFFLSSLKRIRLSPALRFSCALSTVSFKSSLTLSSRSPWWWKAISTTETAILASWKTTQVIYISRPTKSTRRKLFSANSLIRCLSAHLNKFLNSRGWSHCQLLLL